MNIFTKQKCATHCKQQSCYNILCKKYDIESLYNLYESITSITQMHNIVQHIKHQTHALTSNSHII